MVLVPLSSKTASAAFSSTHIHSSITYSQTSLPHLSTHQSEALIPFAAIRSCDKQSHPRATHTPRLPANLHRQFSFRGCVYWEAGTNGERRKDIARAWTFAQKGFEMETLFADTFTYPALPPSTTSSSQHRCIAQAQPPSTTTHGLVKEAQVWFGPSIGEWFVIKFWSSLIVYEKFHYQIRCR